ncbi:hypothetical protein Tco_0212012 [Tanacetum coccineum]
MISHGLNCCESLGWSHPRDRSLRIKQLTVHSAKTIIKDIYLLMTIDVVVVNIFKMLHAHGRWAIPLDKDLFEEIPGLGYSTATAGSPAVESFVNLSDKSRSDKGYHSVPPPLTGNFIPRKPNLTFMDEIVESENLDVTTVVTPSNEKTVENKGVFNTVESNTVRRDCCAPINEDLVSDGKKKTVFPTVSKIEFVGPKQPEKPVKKPMKYAEMFSFDHLKKDCSKRMVKPVWNNARRENHQNSTRMTHPNSKRNMIPQAVLMRSGLKTINTARSRAAVNAAKLTNS